MLDFILNLFNPEKNDEKECQNSTSESVASLEIDYDKLATSLTNAILEANNQIESERCDAENKESAQRQAAWEKALLIKKYEGDNVFLKIVYVIRTFIMVPLGIICFSEKNSTESTGTFVLLKMCNSFLLFAYEWILYSISVLLCLLFFFPIFPDVQEIVGNWTFLIFSLITFFIGRIVRIAKIESQRTTDRQLVLTIFNATVGFTAMIFAIIACFTKQ